MTLLEYRLTLCAWGPLTRVYDLRRLRTGNKVYIYQQVTEEFCT